MNPSIAQLFSLEGQTAVVTGGTRGIGQAMAIALAEAGADIILIQVRNLLRDLSNTSTQSTIHSLSRKCDILPADLSLPSQLTPLLPSILSLVPRIDILLNAAGIQSRCPASSFPSESWDAVLSTNLTSVFTLCRDIGAHMLAQSPHPITHRRGSIINICSLLSFQGGITVPAYAASKGGVLQLTKALSNEWAGKGVNVNAVAPGYVGTDMNEALMRDEKRSTEILARIPMGRWGEPEDFKGVAVWLSGRGSGYVSGECVVVDGGWMGR
ncbi:NAD(P)-binding protein [Sporormia fimetaria CBS 119925]|uniref:NAD(P)-binding protein n=1 Tax=Sporormia fimetaria CBS 119925 TaxID=1340428 RepID=A0A6A6VH74_9PLEO|nr:NAD(P)-binding protein [Sporormia fimetaria CBS 119925]